MTESMANKSICIADNTNALSYRSDYYRIDFVERMRNDYAHAQKCKTNYEIYYNFAVDVCLELARTCTRLRYTTFRLYKRSTFAHANGYHIFIEWVTLSHVHEPAVVASLKLLLIQNSKRRACSNTFPANGLCARYPRSTIAFAQTQVHASRTANAKKKQNPNSKWVVY